MAGIVGTSMRSAATPLADAWDLLSGASTNKKNAQDKLVANNNAGQILSGTAYQQDQMNDNMSNDPTLGSLRSTVNNGDFQPTAFNGQGPGQYTDPQQHVAAYQDNIGSYNPGTFNFQADPGYQFRKTQALDDMQASAAAGGGLFSGATMLGLANKSGQMASDEYKNAFDRFTNQRDFGAKQNNYDRTHALDTYNDVGTMQNSNAVTGLAINKNNYGQFNDARDAHIRTNDLKLRGLQSKIDSLNTVAGYGERSGIRRQAIAGDLGNNLATLATGKGDITSNARSATYTGEMNLLNTLGKTTLTAGGYI